MNSDELDPQSVTHDQEIEDPVVVRNATFTWGENVKNINFTKKNHSSNNDIHCRKPHQQL